MPDGNLSSLSPPPYGEPIDLAGVTRLQLPTSLLMRGDMVRSVQGPGYGSLLRLAVCSLQEVPAGSLPGDEMDLRALAGMKNASEDEWQRVREMIAMHWQMCSDGRYYNPSLVEQVTAMWRQLQGARAGAARSVEVRMQRANVR